MNEEDLREAMSRLTLRPFGGSFVHADDAVVADIEHVVGLPLPLDYQWFLRTYGAGWLGGDSWGVKTAAGEMVSITTLYGAATEPEPCAHSVLWALDRFADGLEFGDVPIGRDRVGDHVLLNARSQSICRQSYYHHGQPRTDAGTGSFTEFLQTLNLVDE